MSAGQTGSDGSQKTHHGTKDATGRIRKLALIGTGKLGEALLSSMLGAQLVPVSHVVATDADPPRADYIGERYAVKATTNNLQAVAGADLVMICVKPQQVAEVLRGIRRNLSKNALVISVAASVTTAMIERALDHDHRVVRVMPNTPCLIRQGMTAIARGKHATPEDLKIAQMIFSAMGRTVIVDEKHMDAITGLSASGPAYVYMIIESLAEGGVKLGLPRELSTELSAQTLLGASALVLHTGEHPAKLKDVVTTPAGCTIDGLLELEEGGLRVTLIKAVVRAAERARQLVQSQDS
jgi:pyrroline-5-carboxylate reductase